MINYIVCIIILIIISWYYQRSKRMSILKRNGIPGPEPHFIFGNMKDYYTKGYNECYDSWQKTYGRIFGYYLGAKPFIVVTEPELLKTIQIKEFNHFSHRPYIIPGGIYRNWKFHQMLSRVDSYRWKKMRSILSPWFSSSQLKSLVPVIKLCIDETMVKINDLAQTNQEFNIYEILEGLTMDTIDRSAFGIKTDIQSNLKNPLIDATRGVFAVKPYEFMASLLLCFPEFSFIINILRDISETILDYLELTSHGLLLKAAKVIYENRIQETNNSNVNMNNRKDLLQLMIDSKDVNTKSENKSSKSMTEIEIIANIIVIHEAAYESPANILAFIIHNLLNNPDIQDSLIEEVENVFSSECDLNYSVMHKLPLTEAVILETFRLFPTDTLFTSRASDIDYRYKSFTIPKGIDIRIPTFQLHRDSQLWSEPLKFKPNRFLPLNSKSIDPVVFQPFGVGPRICPGQRFALLEIKLILATILNKYRLIPGVRTEINDIELDFKLITLSPKNGISLKLEPK